MSAYTIETKTSALPSEVATHPNQIIEEPNFPEIKFTEHQAGHTEMTWQVDGLVVQVLAINGDQVTNSEKEQIRTARKSYARMWGGTPDENSQIEWDGHDDEKPTTTHYIATVTDSLRPEHTTTITMRKISLSLNDLKNQNDLPVELTGWMTETDSGCIPLLETFLTQLDIPDNRLNPDEPLIANISRGATISNGNKDDRDRDRSAIAFASINYLASRQDIHQYWLCELNHMLQHKAFAITDSLGERHSLEFNHTQTTLGIDSAVVLNKHSIGIRSLISHYPGYWLDYNHIPTTLEQAIQSNIISKDELMALLNPQPDTEQQISPENITTHLGKPKNVQLLIPLLQSKPELLDHLIQHVPDGPFSATFSPTDWQQTTAKLMRATQQKYAPETQNIDPTKLAFQLLTLGVTNPDITQAALTALIESTFNVNLDPHHHTNQIKAEFAELQSTNDTLTTSDLVHILEPSTNPADLETVKKLLSELSPQDRDTLQVAYIDDIKTLWKLKPDNRFDNLDQFIDHWNCNYKGAWVVNRMTGEITRYLPKELHQQVLYSRLFPLISHQEQSKFAQSPVVMIGASTGAMIAQGLAQTGFTKLTLIDPDFWTSSNLTRAGHASGWDRGRNKAQTTGYNALGINPWLDVTIHTTALDQTQLSQVIESNSIVVEMVDHKPTKASTRQLAIELKKPVFMGNNVEWYTSLSVDLPDSQVTDFSGDGIAAFIQAIGPHNLPPRQMANFILAQTGHMPYLAQFGPNAAGGEYLAVKAIQAQVLGHTIDQRSHLDVRRILNIKPEDSSKSDDQLLKELQHQFPNIFTTEFTTLNQAVVTLCKTHFDIDYSWAY